jgi:hypothetical protein
MGSDPNNYDHFLSRIAGGPVTPDAPIIEQGVFVPNDAPGTYTVHNMAHYDGVLLSVHFSTAEKQFVEGSAVMVAPGIAIAAAHVIGPRAPAIKDGSLHIFCNGLTPSGLRHWKVRHVCEVGNSDLFVLSLEYASPIEANSTFKQAVISTRLPCVGEPIMIAGFRATRSDFEVRDGDLVYEGNVRIGVGTVTERYSDGRDRKVLPWPTIEVDCSTKGGMSGGPAFDKNGRLIGILTSSFETEDDLGPSYVSLLWPALVVTIVPAWLQEFVGGPKSLLEMDRQLCGIDRPNAIVTRADPSTGQIRLEVKHWEE